MMNDNSVGLCFLLAGVVELLYQVVELVNIYHG